MEQENAAEAREAGFDAVVASAAGERKKAAAKPRSDTEKLIEFMGSKYGDVVAGVQSFDEFYHAIFELIEMFCEERGQLQYRIPNKETLRKAYERHHRSESDDGEAVKKEEFVEMSKELLLRRESFSLGRATAELALVLFGGPACAVAAKRALPGLLGWLSDDVLVPLATSGSVAYLINTKRL